MDRVRYVAFVFLMALLSTGCESFMPAGGNEPRVDLVAELQKAAKTLLGNTQGLEKHKRVLVTTLVSVDNLRESSTFGRQVAEVFTSEIARTGLPVVELRMRDSIFVREGTGELMLSRELHHLYASHNAQAVLVGTYAIARDSLFVNVRLVQVSTNLILGSHSFALPINRDVRTLIAS